MIRAIVKFPPFPWLKHALLGEFPDDAGRFTKASVRFFVHLGPRGFEISIETYLDNLLSGLFHKSARIAGRSPILVFDTMLTYLVEVIPFRPFLSC